MLTVLAMGAWPARAGAFVGYETSTRPGANGAKALNAEMEAVVTRLVEDPDPVTRGAAPAVPPHVYERELLRHVLDWVGRTDAQGHEVLDAWLEGASPATDIAILFRFVGRSGRFVLRDRIWTPNADSEPLYRSHDLSTQLGVYANTMLVVRLLPGEIHEARPPDSDAPQVRRLRLPVSPEPAE